jgi:hypothetical protein
MRTKDATTLRDAEMSRPIYSVKPDTHVWNIRPEGTINRAPTKDGERSYNPPRALKRPGDGRWMAKDRVGARFIVPKRTVKPDTHRRNIRPKGTINRAPTKDGERSHNPPRALKRQGDGRGDRINPLHVIPVGARFIVPKRTVKPGTHVRNIRPMGTINRAPTKDGERSYNPPRALKRQRDGRAMPCPGFTGGKNRRGRPLCLPTDYGWTGRTCVSAQSRSRHAGSPCLKQGKKDQADEKLGFRYAATPARTII